MYFAPGHVLMIFLNFNNEVVDLGMEQAWNMIQVMCFTCLHQKPLNSYFQTLLYFEYGCIDYAFYEQRLVSSEIYLS